MRKRRLAMMMATGILGGGRVPYIKRIQSIFGTDLLSHLIMGEASGTTAADASGNSRTGAYSGVTLGQPGMGDGNTCPTFDGTEDFVNWYTASLRSAFPGKEGGLICWVKISAAVWAEETTRYIARFYVDDPNLLYMSKPNVVDGLQFRYTAGGTAKTVTTYAYGGNENWMCIVMTWSDAGDVLNIYVNGELAGTASGIGTWSGLPGSGNMAIGAYSTAATFSFLGSVANCSLINRLITAPEAASVWRANPRAAAA